MADVKEISKKRTRVTRSLMGSFTRVHRGRNNSDLLQPSVKKQKNSSPLEDSSIRNDSSSVSIKDLRLKRVFSPSSTDGQIPNCFDDTENLGKSQNGDLKKTDKPKEDFTETTSMDPEIFRAEPVVKRNGSEFSMKSVLKPCSREKLFKAPGSFSYRRLLPFLTDIEKDRSGSQTTGQSQKSEKGFDDKHLLVSNGPKTVSDKTTSCSLVGCNTDTGKPLIAASLESFTSKDNELRASRDDQNSSCLKKDLSSAIENSHFNEENLAGVVSCNRTLTDNDEVARTNVEYPCDARGLEVLDQSLSIVNDKGETCDHEVPERSKDDTKKSAALPEMGGNSKCSLEQRVDNEVVGRVENLNGECMSMTPPDSDVFSKCEIDDSRHNKPDYVSQGTGQVIQKSTNETLCRNNGQGHDSQDSSPKNKMVPNPHLHLKLSKISGSFNYRRLLPYLAEITSLNSGAPGNNQTPKVDKSSKCKLLSPFFTPGKDTCTETFNHKSHPVEHHTGDDTRLPVAVVAATSTSSSNCKLTQSSPKQVAESPMIIDPQQEPGLLVEPSALDLSQKSGTRPKDVVESPDMSSSSPSEEGSKFVAYRLPLETEEDCVKSTEKCANHERQIEADNCVEASTPHEIPSAGLRKGILKRNPRGCRGICTCLNCSSFRLHAERSFEFSRNQMQDAKEVALDLMKELSYLRNMLEKSAFVAKDQTTICIDKVKEAIKKASDSEELAKTRLNEMNYDLNIHCRVPCAEQPSVRFADYVQEHVVRPIEDSSNK